MSKYQEVMDHIKVDDEMKKRILQNVEKKLEEAPKEVVAPKPKVVPFKRYAAIAATFAVLLVGSYAVMQTTGGMSGKSNSTSMYAPAMEEATEAPAEAPAMDKTEDISAVEPDSGAEVVQPVLNSASPESAAKEVSGASSKAVVPIVLTAVIAIFIIAAVIIFVRKRKR